MNKEKIPRPGLELKQLIGDLNWQESKNQDVIVVEVEPCQLVAAVVHRSLAVQLSMVAWLVTASAAPCDSVCASGVGA